MLFVSWLQRLLNGRKTSRTRSSARHRTAPGRRTNLRVRRLEPRRVLNGLPLLPVGQLDAGAGMDADVSDMSWDDLGGVTVDAGADANDGADDIFHVSRDGNDVTVNLGGNEIYRGAFENIDQLTIAGSNDNDTLMLDMAAGDSLPAITFLAGEQSSETGDTVVISGAGDWDVGGMGESFTFSSDTGGGVYVTLDSVESTSVAADSLSLQGMLDLGSGSLNVVSSSVDVDGVVSTVGGEISITSPERIDVSADSSLIATSGHVSLDAGEDGVLQFEGTIDVSSSDAVGGSAELLGKYVTVGGAATVDASGANGGGTLLIGGDFQGSNPDIHNATATVVSQDAVLLATGIGDSDGGRIIVWSDNATVFRGSLDVAGGTGGFAEVSGKGYLDFDPVSVSVGGGTLLLDPNSITVIELLALADINGDFVLTDDIVNATDLDNAAGDFAGAASIISDDRVQNLLGMGNLALRAVNTITIDAAIDEGGLTGDLTLEAPTVDVNAAITLDGGASLIINATTITLDAAVTLTTGTLTMNVSGVASQTVAIAGTGNVSMTGSGTFTLSQANTYTGTTTVSAGTLVAGNATALGTTGNGTSVTAGGTLEIDNAAIGKEAITLNGTGVGAAGALQGTNTASLSGTVAMASDSSIGGTGTLGLSGIVSGGFNLTKVGSGTVTLSGANTYTGTTTVSVGTLVAANVTALGTTGGGTSVTSGATLEIDNVAIGTEALTLSGTGVGNAGALQGTNSASLSGTVAMASNSSIGGTGTLALTGVVSGGFDLTKVGVGTLTLSATNSYTGSTQVDAGILALGATGVLDDTSTINVNGGTLSMTTFDDTVATVTLTSGSITGTSGVLTSTNAF
ncbi:MAG: autotransporter-associated beta strand repeat-containing protein, partial [Planctomycetota bacterium]|nr:autotransporter-associated beta strand repeat-containing protein [Planctomycetota bacterium]